MSDLALILSHVASFCAGALMWGIITVREAPSLTYTEAPNMSPTARARRNLAIIIILITACMVLVGFGVQQSLYQRDVERRGECLDAWGEEFSAAIEKRSSVSVRVEKAEQARARAIDAIVLTLIAVRSDDVGRKRAEREISRVLLDFAKTKNRVDRVRDRANRTRQVTEYPELDC